MSGKHVTDRQVRLYMNSRKDGHTRRPRPPAPVSASGPGGGSRGLRSCRASGNGRRYRTRPDPFAEVWRAELVPLLADHAAFARHDPTGGAASAPSGPLSGRALRSLQRRVAHWRATEGPERELIFRQDHPPGRQALSDFTDGGGLGLPSPDSRSRICSTISGSPSGWRFVKAICGGESFTALTEGLQEALWQLGGVPREHRTDRLSAAYRNLSNRDDEAARYAAFCRHYGMEPTRNNAGVSHENGSVEAAHGHLKTGLEEALELRGLEGFCRPGRLPGFPAGVCRAQECPAARRGRRRAGRALAAAAAPHDGFLERDRHRDALGHDLGKECSLHRALASGRLPG